MEEKYVLPLADSQATLAVAGGKGASLARLAKAELPVPDGFHVTTQAYQRFIQANGLQPRILEALDRVDPADPGSLESASGHIRELILGAPIPQEIVDAIAREYEDFAGELPTVAVRSSATAEDLPELSFAGQQETFLNIEGVPEVLDAVRKCWASLWTARAIGYRARSGIDSAEVALAVVVQLMVPAQASGVLFTANPVNGRRDQAVINAAWGLGESIVGGEVTPDTLVVDKETGRILERDTADKQHMTVGQKNGTTTQTVPDDLRYKAVLDDQAAAELVKLGVQIEQLYEIPMDIEWTRTNGQFSIVQARPITALPEPEAPAPSRWPMPDPKGKYMRASIIDVLPEPLSPLFRTMGIRMLNEGTKYLMEVELGAKDALPEDYYQTINDYAYMSMGFTPRQWLKFLLIVVPGMRKIMKTGIQRWREDALPRYQATVQRWEARPVEQLAPTELLEGAQELAQEAIYYLNILQLGAMPLPAQSEAIFTNVYDRLIRKEGDPQAPTLLMGYDSKPIRGEKDLYDMAQWVKERPALADYLQNTPTQQLITQFTGAELEEALPEEVPVRDWHSWRERFQAHLDEYGHSIYDLDFANPVPADDPAPLLEMLKLFLSGKGKDPYQRQQSIVERREQAEAKIESRLGPVRSWLFSKTLKRAQRLAPIREEGIADIGLGYPKLRAMLHELGCRLVAAGALQEPDDIYWLEEAEVERAAQALEQGEALAPYQESVSERKATWRGEKRVSPPAQIPSDLRVLGINFSKWLPTHEEEQVGNQIKGLGASPGRVSAPACVLLGPEDFEQMDPGEVLVAAITTPAWTPLFARASAVVTDIGGPLSHGSIVAREYGIPAVLGTGVATRRIRSGQLITVDGDAGIVTLPEEES